MAATPSVGEVRSIIPDGCGGWYVGGAFTHSVGQTNFNNVFHIKNDKQVDTVWNPNVVGASVRAMVLNQPNPNAAGTLYIGGTFTSVEATPRVNLAAISKAPCNQVADGIVAQSWNPAPTPPSTP